MLQWVTLFLFLVAYPAFASEEAELTFSRDSQWVRSLHYRKTENGYQWRTKKPGFYLADEADPAAELKANLQAARQDPLYACRFPYRAELLRRVRLLGGPAASCPEFDDFRSLIKGDKLSIVFASQYLSNPASAFGHTFLMISPEREGMKPHPPYLDFTIGYAAFLPENGGPWDYIYKGLTGGFDGKFSFEPFYTQVHTYANMELRDLWVYPVNISKEKIDGLIAHLYELKRGNYFPYYFLDENCSSVHLRLFEVLYPELKLAGDFPLYVLPLESLKTLDRHDLLRAGRFVPSARTELIRGYEFLTHDEKENVHQAIKNLDPADVGSPAALNTVVAHLDKKKTKGQGQLSEEMEDFYQKALLARARVGVRPQEDHGFDVLDPLKAHGPFAFAIRGGDFEDDGFSEVEFRPAAHELLDLNHGYIRYSQMRFLTPTLRNDEKGLRLQKFEFLDMMNLVPYKAIDPLFSWKATIKWMRASDGLCLSCKLYHSDVGAGISLNFDSWLDVYLLPGLSIEWGEDLAGGYRAGPGGQAGLIFNYKEKVKLHFSASYYYADKWRDLQDSVMRFRASGNYSFSTALSLQASWSETRTQPSTHDVSEASGGLIYYF